MVNFGEILIMANGAGAEPRASQEGDRRRRISFREAQWPQRLDSQSAERAAVKSLERSSAPAPIAQSREAVLRYRLR